MTVALEQVRVEIDATTPDEVFTAWTDPTITWNGWATPAFDKDEALKVIAWVDRVNADLDPTEKDTFVWEGETLYQVSAFGIPDDEYRERVGPDSAGRYHIGSFCWTWAILEDAPLDRDELAAWLTARSEETRRYCEAANTALHAAYDRGASVEEACAASKAAGDAVIWPDRMRG